MSKHRRKLVKIADDGATVTLYRSTSAEWFVGRPGEDLAYHPTPMGAFGSEQAARSWADRHFPGGEWRGRVR